MFDTPKPLHVRVGERYNHMDMRLLDAIFLVVESPFFEDIGGETIDPLKEFKKRDGVHFNGTRSERGFQLGHRECFCHGEMKSRRE